MRRFDKIKVIRKANLLNEQRYFESKGLMVENDNSVERIKNALSIYGDIINFFETPISKKFKIGDRRKISDKNGIFLPELSVELRNEIYDRKTNSFIPNSESFWEIILHDYTPNGRDRDKVILNTNNVDEVIKVMNKYAKKIIKNKVN
jgi:hypothetical protein